jgi:S-formylglutathione hydrolase FrmB
MKYLILVLTLYLSTSLSSQTIQVRIDTAIKKSLTGKLYLFLQSDTSKRVPNNPDPSQPMFAWNIQHLQKETTLSINKADYHLLPEGLKTLKPGYYKMAGVIDTDFEERGTFNPGNVYARKEVLLQVKEQGESHTSIVFESQVTARKFRETDQLKEVVLKSTLLSSFRKKDIFMKAGIRLPASYYTDTNRHYPLVLVIPGWGGTHYDLANNATAQRYGMTQGKDKIYLYLNPETQSPYGLHAFVDSRVNGPWGKALVEELIPYIAQQYRIVKETSQHFVMGQSTGGYASLWLQLHYPEAFGGCWAVSPDPVDFSSYIGINLYAKNANVFYDEQGKPIGTFFMDGKPLMTTKQMSDLETFLGDGEQLQAFEAEFGLPDKNGRPRILHNRITGKVDAAVLKTWEPYDLGLFIQKHGQELEPKLQHKVHVYAGANDNFRLHEAVQAFGKKAAGTSAIAELIPGADHWSIWSPAFTQRVQNEIDARIK